MCVAFRPEIESARAAVKDIMNPEQVRVHALQIALQYQGEPRDLNDLFVTSDQIASYISGQKPQAPFYWNTQDVLELKRCADDPLAFFEKLSVQHPIKGSIPFDLYGFQKDLIKHIEKHRFSVINHARQMGVTTCVAGYALWQALMKPDQTILIISNKFNSVMEIMSRVRFMFENLPDHLKAKTETNNKTTVVFENGSRIIGRAASPDAARGLRANTLIIDNACYISHSLSYGFWNGIQPILSAPGSRCIVYSTAYVAEGLFYQIWTGANREVTPDGCGANAFAALQLPWHVHPERDEAWAQPFRDALGPIQWARDFEGQFVSDAAPPKPIGL